jgi:hypothetical protein
MDSIKPLYTAVASVTGSRNRHAEPADHCVSDSPSCRTRSILGSCHATNIQLDLKL